MSDFDRLMAYASLSGRLIAMCEGVLEDLERGKRDHAPYQRRRLDVIKRVTEGDDWTTEELDAALRAASEWPTFLHERTTVTARAS